MEFLTQYMTTENICQFILLLTIGRMLKEWGALKNNLIPFILLGLSIVISVLLLGFNMDAIMEGGVITSLAVYGNQIFKQAVELIKGGDDIG